MIIKVAKHGHSFKGAAAYYLHDKTEANAFNRSAGNAQTSDRVAFTETRNLATENPDTAWKVMAATSMDSEHMKQQARETEGKRSQASGNTQASSVYSFSIAWHPDEAGKISREEMTTAANDTLERLGLQDHQALLVAHNDTDHPHIHVMVNKTNPTNGQSAKIWNDYKTLDKFAAEYRQQRGEEHYCPERAKKWLNHENGVSNKNRKKQTNTKLESGQSETMRSNDPAAQKVRRDQAKLGNRISDIGKRMKQANGEAWDKFKAQSKADRSAIYDRYNPQIEQARKWADYSYRQKAGVYDRYDAPMKNAKDRLAQAKFAKSAIYDKFKSIHAREYEKTTAKFKAERKHAGREFWKAKREWHNNENSLGGRLSNAIQGAHAIRNATWSRGFLKDVVALSTSAEKRAGAFALLEINAFDKISERQKRENAAVKRKVNEVRKIELAPAVAAYNSARNEISELHSNRKAELDPLIQANKDAKQQVKQLFNHRKGELEAQKAMADHGYNSLKTSQAEKGQQLQRVWGKLKARRSRQLDTIKRRQENKQQQRTAHQQAFKEANRDEAVKEAKTRTRNRSKERKPRTRSRGQKYGYKPE